MKKAPRLLIILYLILFTLSCENEQLPPQEERLAEPMGEGAQADPGFELFLLDPSDIPAVTEEIGPAAKNKLRGPMSKKGTGPVSIDTKNILGVKDSVGNITYALRLYWPQGPKNSIFNLVVNKRRDGQKNPPFIMEYEMDRGKKKAVRFYSLDGFLNGAKGPGTGRKGDGWAPLVPCGELDDVTGSQGGSPSGGGGNGAFDPNAPRNSGNSYRGMGSSYTVFTYGGAPSRGGGGRVEMGSGCFCAWAEPVNALKSAKGDKDPDCPRGEMLLPVNEGEDHVHLIDEADNPCISNILAKLQQKDMQRLTVPDIGGLGGTGHLSQGILDLFDKSGDLELTFKVAEAGWNRNATTKGRGREIDIILDEEFVKNATQLVIARTIIHESVHAYLMYATSRYSQSDTATLLRDYREQNNNDRNISQHKYMTQFTDAIGYSLAVWANDIHNPEYYQSLAWSGGLLTSESFSELDDDRQSAIMDANLAEGNANNSATNNARGTRCN